MLKRKSTASELVALTPIRKKSTDIKRKVKGPNPDFSTLTVAAPPVPSPARLFSNEALAPISRLSSLFVCSRVLLRISRSAVRFTLKDTNSSYLRRREEISANICSGVIFSKLEPSEGGTGRLLGFDVAPSAPWLTIRSSADLPSGATTCRTCSFLLNISAVALLPAEFHIPVRASVNPFPTLEDSTAAPTSVIFDFSKI
mmetsp:Transcript_9932/g.11618  ORF Transcript_9932/g.11618 Transcript_9932/m.11618 type:complete len:200 (-) Transcript_9932:521-1120(-)